MRVLAAVMLAGASLAHAQPAALAPVQNCDVGRIKLADRSGQVEICSAIAAQLPALQQQLSEAIRLIKSQQPAGAATSADIDRLIQTINGVSANIGVKRQTDMLKNLQDELRRNQGQGPDATQRLVQTLNAQFEQLSQQLLAKLGNRATSAQAGNALDGEVGEAIARLEPATATRLLDKLTAIDTRLADVQTTVKNTAGDVRTLLDQTYPALLADASKTKPKGDIGQNNAARALTDAGRSLSGLDLSGVAFVGAQLAKMSADEINLTLSNLSTSDFSDAHFDRADLTATRLDGTVFDRAHMDDALFAFAVGSSPRFRQASLVHTSWTGASLAGADFSRADLHGSTFEHADLRGANFTGANLAGVFFGNADLRDAKFTDAVFKNVDVVSAVFSTAVLSDAQRAGLCATARRNDDIWPRGESFVVIERIPSSKYDGGFENRRIFDNSLYTLVGGERPYPACEPRAKGDLPRAFLPVYPGKPEQWTDFQKLFFESALLESGGRRRELQERIGNSLASARARGDSLYEMPQFAKIRAAIDRSIQDRLASLKSKAAPQKPPEFNSEIAMLFAGRLQPALYRGTEWPWQTLAFWQLAAPINSPTAAWPRLYPEKMLVADLSPVALAAIKTWNQYRIDALPSLTMTLKVRAASKSGTPNWASLFGYEGKSGSANEAFAKTLGVPASRVAVFREGFNSNYKLTPFFAFVFDADPRADAPAGDMPMTMKSLKVVNTNVDGRQVDVWVWNVSPK